MSSPLQTLIRDLQRRRARERRGLALAEGVRLVEEVIAAGIAVRGAAVSPALEATTRGQALKAALVERLDRLDQVTDSELEELADTEHPQGVIAVIEPRRWELDQIRMTSGAVVLALDGVQDPGNVGAMLRTAHGLAAAGLIALKGTADLTNPKVLRGAMGASFHLPAVPATAEQFVAWARLQRARIWAAAREGEPIRNLMQPAGERPAIALVVGNEGAGLSPAIESAADQHVAIRLRREVESLNVAVAAGILLHEITGGG